MTRDDMRILLDKYLEVLVLEESLGTSLQELRACTSRIGELHAAMSLEGQFPSATNQRGWDVLTPAGQKISVKTHTRINNKKIKVRCSTLHLVDRVLIYYLAVEDGKMILTLQADVGVDVVIAKSRKVEKDQYYDFPY